MVHPVSDVHPAPAAGATAAGPHSPTSPNPLVTLFNDARKLIAANGDVYVERLAEAVAVESVSTDLSKRPSCFEMADLLARWISELGGRCDKVLVGFQELDDARRFDLPPVLMADFRDPAASRAANAAKPTVLVYAHYDVAPADADHLSTRAVAGEWASHPFTLAERDGELFARGASSNKGPLLAWLWAVEVFRELGASLPVNLKLCIEGMQTSASECLHDLVEREAAGRGFLADVDYVVVSDSLWLTPEKPCLTYGLRGLASFALEVRAPHAPGAPPSSNGSVASVAKAGSTTSSTARSDAPAPPPSSDLSEGVSGGGGGGGGAPPAPLPSSFAGAVHEPMTDLVQVLAALTAGGHADVAIPGCERDALPAVSADERDAARGVCVDGDALRAAAGRAALVGGDDVAAVLLNRWRFPAVSISGVEAGGARDGTIGGAASARVALRLAPGQTVAAAEAGVRKVAETRFAALGSGNELGVTTTGAADAWLGDPKCALFVAGAAASLKVHGVKPDMIRDGGSIGMVDVLQRTLGAQTMLLPLGASDDAPGGPNEKIGRRQYLAAVHLLFTLLSEIARVHADRDDTAAGRPARGAFGRLKDIWFGLS